MVTHAVVILTIIPQYLRGVSSQSPLLMGHLACV